MEFTEKVNLHDKRYMVGRRWELEIGDDGLEALPSLTHWYFCA